VRKRPLGRLEHRWVDNTKDDLRKIGWGVLNWIGLAQYEDIWRSLVYEVMNLWVAENAGRFLCCCTSDDLSSCVQLHRIC
jgi:hypothetical protein